jgi:hypothetical protein
MGAYIRMRKKSKEKKENTISRNLTQVSDFPFVYRFRILIQWIEN